MDPNLWPKMHGATTHFPIALIMAATLFDLLGTFVPENAAQSRRAGFRAAGFYTLILGALGSLGAVASGILMTHGELLGTGNLGRHHAFLWPAFGLLITLAVWRLVVRERASRRAFKIYLFASMTTCALMSGAGYWGGELLLNG